VRGHAITTATDIYSLGAVLYELLTDVRPHKFTSPTPLEIERAICDTEILKPSDVVKQTSPTKFARQLTGEVDNIVLMAMRKEPERRYASVEQFSEDIQRYLDERPVIARPDTFAYRTTKFVRRNRLPLVAASLILLSLIGGIVATAREASIAKAATVRAETERARAEHNLAEAQAQRTEAETQRADAVQQRARA
jgi:serine/threonine protein kinase